MTPAEFKSHRSALGMTQAALAKVLGCGPRAIRYWESGAWPVPSMAAMSMLYLRESADG